MIGKDKLRGYMDEKVVAKEENIRCIRVWLYQGDYMGQ